MTEPLSTDPWIRAGQRMNALRIVPRVLIAGYYGFSIYAWFYVVNWFMEYDWAAITNQAVALALAGFPAIILGTITTVLGALTNNYFRTGPSDPK